MERSLRAVREQLFRKKSFLSPSSFLEVSAEALPTYKMSQPLVLEPPKASLIQQAMLRVLARRPHQGTNDSTPSAPISMLVNSKMTFRPWNRILTLNLWTAGHALLWIQIHRADTRRPRLAKRDHHPILP